MKKLHEIINVAGTFFCEIANDIVPFCGVLCEKNDIILLQCKVTIVSYRKMDLYESHRIWGNVSGVPITLLNAYINSGTVGYFDSECSLVFEPSEIVVGRSCSKEFRIKKYQCPHPL